MSRHLCGRHGTAACRRFAGVNIREGDPFRENARSAGGAIWTVHAVQEALNDALAQQDVEDALSANGEVIERYPKDPRGPSCLTLAHLLADQRPVHSVVGYGGNPWVIVTVYRPDLQPQTWSPDFRRRRCGGRMELRHIEMLSKWGSTGQHVLVTDVPVWVCERCGEQVLEHDTARAVEAAVRRTPTTDELREIMFVRPLSNAGSQ